MQPRNTSGQFKPLKGKGPNGREWPVYSAVLGTCYQYNDKGEKTGFSGSLDTSVNPFVEPLLLLLEEIGDTRCAEC